MISFKKLWTKLTNWFLLEKWNFAYADAVYLRQFTKNEEDYFLLEVFLSNGEKEIRKRECVTKRKYLKVFGQSTSAEVIEDFDTKS